MPKYSEQKEKGLFDVLMIAMIYVDEMMIVGGQSAARRKVRMEKVGRNVGGRPRVLMFQRGKAKRLWPIRHRFGTAPVTP